MLKIAKQTEIRAKGFEQPVTVSEVLGIGGRHKLSLVQTREPLVALAQEIPVSYSIAEGSRFNGEVFRGSLTRLSIRRAEVRLEAPVPIFSNMELLLTGTEGKRVSGSLHCKVVGAMAGGDERFSVHFTSMSPEVETFIRGLVGSGP
jgi:adenylate cyclase